MPDYVSIQNPGDELPTLAFKRSSDGATVHYIPPKDKWELQEHMQRLFGLTVAGTSVCPGHDAPLDALAASYFAEAPLVVWKASRGFGGKTSLLAGLAGLELLSDMNIMLLGASGEQSRRVHAYTKDAWNYLPMLEGKQHISPFTKIVSKGPNSHQTVSDNGFKLAALTASQASVRGPHPHRLRLDEVDEMDKTLYDASLGQTMDDEPRGIMGQITVSSTHQYANGTMTKVIEDAVSKGFPVFQWCYKESRSKNRGWLSDRQIRSKRSVISEAMWNAEYELQEPAIEGRVLSNKHLDRLFGISPVKPGRLPQQIDDFEDRKSYIFEPPQKNARYSTGCDWGKDKDWTEIVTLRVDTKPMRLVAYERAKAESYPSLVNRFASRLMKYQGIGVHDSRGVGNAIADYISYSNVIDHKTGKKADLYLPLVMAIEQGTLSFPLIKPLHAQFRYWQQKHINTPKAHPPDGVCAVALALFGIGGATTNLGKGSMSAPAVVGDTPQRIHEEAQSRIASGNVSPSGAGLSESELEDLAFAEFLKKHDLN